MKMKRSFTYLILLALVAGLLAACGEEPTPNPGSNNPTSGASTTAAASGNAAAIIKDSVGAAVAITDYQATIDLTYTGTGAGNLTMDVVLKGSLAATDDGPAALPQFKGTVTKSSLPTIATGTVAVLGKSTLLYDPANKVVLKGGASAASSEVYNLFLGSQTKAATLFSSDLATPTVAGEEKVGSYNTTRINFVPKEGVASTFGKGAKGSVWIDKDSKLPVQLDYSEEAGGQKWTVSNLQVNKGVDDAKLSFTPPAEAQVVDAGQFGQAKQVANLDEAKTTAGFGLATVSYLPGDLPKNPTAVSVQTTPVGNIITADYTVKATAPIVTPFPNAKGKDPAQNQKGISIRALKSTVNLPSNLPSGAVISDVTVGGQKGTLAALNDTTAILTFAKDGVFYTITSSGYGKDEVTKVAEGLK
jgi:outer membrane lipoprotein-sorting protein